MHINKSLYLFIVHLGRVLACGLPSCHTMYFLNFSFELAYNNMEAFHCDNSIDVYSTL
jgi:hypothetical protein